MGVCLEMARASKAGRDSRLTEVQARRVLSDILAFTGDDLHIQVTRDYFEHWLTTRELTKAPGTARRYRHVVGLFLRSLGKKADLPLSTLTPNDVEVFRSAESQEGKSSTTTNLAIKTLRIPLNLARRQGVILTNPAEAIELLPSSSLTRDFFTWDQIKALLSVSDAEWRGMILIAALAGLRLGDIANLKVANLDLERRALSFFPQKDKRGTQRRKLEVPLHPDVERYFLDLPISEDSLAPLFPELSKRRIGGATGLSSKFRRLMKKAGVVADVVSGQIGGKGRRFYNLGFHALRHSFVTGLANQNVHQDVRMRLAGHATNVHTRYSHHDLEVLRKNVAMLPSTTR